MLIHAKPLKRKHLRAERTLTDSYSVPSSPRRITAESPSNPRQISSIVDEDSKTIEKKIPKIFGSKKLKDLFILCVKAMPGSTSGELDKLAILYCKQKEIVNSLDGMGSYAAILLKELVEEGKITRIKVIDPEDRIKRFRYYEIVK